MKQNQEAIRRTLDAKGIKYKEIDVADPRYKSEKEKMQEQLKLNNEDLVALPPQIFKEEQHCGDFETFFSAVEEEKVFSYLDLDPPKGEVEYARLHEPKVPDAGYIDQGEIVQLKYV